MSENDESDATLEAFRVPLDAAEPTFSVIIRGVDGGVTLGGGGLGRVVVGSGETVDVRLEGRLVSRRHVALELTGPCVTVTDLGSTNGTWIHGVRIHEAEVRGGEPIVVGEHTLTIEPGPSAPARLGRELRFGQLLGASKAMRRLYPLFERLAASNASVVIQGEAGTGKETLAESLHAEGPRRDQAFVVLDCAAVAPDRFEQALSDSIARAAGGTLLLDDIAELSLIHQAQLLRDIERGRARDLRILVTTRRELDDEVQAGRFREDLLHRLSVARVELPPLRRRREDIPLLAAHFASELGHHEPLPKERLASFQDRAWPGNVRELQNQVARVVALGEVVDLEGPNPRTAPIATSMDWLALILAENLILTDARERVNEVFERRYVEHMLAAHGGNVVRAAARSGVARRYFQILKAKRVT